MGGSPARWSLRWPFRFDEPVFRYFLLSGVPYFLTDLILGEDRKARRLEDLAPRRFYDLVQVTLLLQQVRGGVLVLIAVVLFGALRVPQPTGVASVLVYTVMLWPFCSTLPLAPTLKSLPEPPAVRPWRLALVRWSPLLSLVPALLLAYLITHAG